MWGRKKDHGLDGVAEVSPTDGVQSIETSDVPKHLLLGGGVYFDQLTKYWGQHYYLLTNFLLF